MVMNSIVLECYDYWKNPSFNGEMSINDYESIAFLLDRVEKQNMQIFEIGTRKGSSATLLAMYAKKNEGRCYTADNYCTYDDGSSQDMLFYRDQFYKHINKLKLNPWIEQWYMSSEEASKKVNDNTFDMVFIDGSHLYNNVIKDLDCWYPKVKSGGILCGHDCELLLLTPFLQKTFKSNSGIDSRYMHWENKDMLFFHFGVIMAVSEKFPNAQIIGDRIWWIKKP
jgi:hypothetical protein